TFYFLLTGRPPFGEGSVAQKLIWHQTRQPKGIRSVRPEVPEGLVAVIDKMMAKDPARRYQRPGEVAEALAPYTQTPIGPPPEVEMPQFSTAATGEPSMAASINPVTSTPSTPGPRKVWQVPAAPGVRSEGSPSSALGDSPSPSPQPPAPSGS